MLYVKKNSLALKVLGLRHNADRLQVSPSARLGETGVDQGQRVLAPNESGVIQSPTAVQLNVGVDAGTDFLHAWRRQLRRVMVVGRGHADVLLD